MNPVGYAFEVVQEGLRNLAGEQGVAGDLGRRHVHDDHDSKEPRCE